jgi:alpha-tubulin suppressor-like RCC1 family protein
MPVVGLGRKATAIAAGEFHTCALLDDGTARCWGDNFFGQLGDGTTTISRTTPVTVSGLSNVTAIAAGWGHTCAVLNDGTARCWGDNFFGQLGDGTTTISRTTPVTVSGLSNVTAIAAGLYHTCALLTDKTVRCWGSNRYGQLGDGTRGVSRTTLEAVSGLSNVTAIAAGGSHTCAQLGNETARCWGFNEYGQLGNGELGFATTPSLAYTAASAFFPILRRP